MTVLRPLYSDENKGWTDVSPGDLHSGFFVIRRWLKANFRGGVVLKIKKPLISERLF